MQALGDVRQRALEETRASAASRAQAESAASAARADARAAHDELARLQVLSVPKHPGVVFQACASEAHIPFSDSAPCVDTLSSRAFLQANSQASREEAWAAKMAQSAVVQDLVASLRI